MIYKINIVASHVVAICEELLSSLTKDSLANGIRNTAINCLNDNKKAVGLESFYLYAEKRWEDSFIVFLKFDNYDDCIKICFNLSNVDNYVFTASVIGPYRIISKPILQKPTLLNIDKFVYCNPCHNILYLDDVIEGEMFGDDLFFSFEEANLEHDSVKSSKQETLLSFTDRLTDEEKKLMKIANLNRWDCFDKDSYNYRELFRNIDKWKISCVVIRDLGFLKKLKPLLPIYCNCMAPNEILTPFTKKDWVRRIILSLFLRDGIISLWQFENYNFSKELRLCMKQFERDFCISEDIIASVHQEIVHDIAKGNIII